MRIKKEDIMDAIKAACCALSISFFTLFINSFLDNGFKKDP